MIWGLYRDHNPLFPTIHMIWGLYRDHNPLFPTIQQSLRNQDLAETRTTLGRMMQKEHGGLSPRPKTRALLKGDCSLCSISLEGAFLICFPFPHLTLTLESPLLKAVYVTASNAKKNFEVSQTPIQP